MRLLIGAFLCVALCGVSVLSKNDKLKEVFNWKYIDYAWKKPEDRDAAISSGEFVPANNLPLGLEVWKDKLFITVPRWKSGVVSTLNYVKLSDNEKEQLGSNNSQISWESNSDGNEEISNFPVTPQADDNSNSTEVEETDSNPGSIEDLSTRQTLLRRLIRSSHHRKDKTEISEKRSHRSEDKNLRAVKRKSRKSHRRDRDGEKEEGKVKARRKKNKKNKSKRKKEEKEHKRKKEDKEHKPKKEKKKKKKKYNTTPAPTNPGSNGETQPPLPPPQQSTSLLSEVRSPSWQPRSPPFIPYPSFEENRVFLNGTGSNEANPIVSVFRVSADACDRLWVMDTGVADILGNTEVVSKPRILIYDLNTDKLIKTYEFKNGDTEEHSFFANIIVDVDPQNCNKAFAYVPDLGGYGIVSYDLEKDKSKRFKHNYFHFDPLAGNMNVGGVNFQWTDGVFSIALTKRMDDGFRTAFFHCLASTKEFSVNTKILQSDDDTKVSYYDYKLIGDRGENSQSSASYIHEDSGIMFYTQLQKDSVNCWNTNKPLVQENLAEVASDNETMIFTNDLKVDRSGNLWVLTDKLPVFIYRDLADNEINYRIFTSTVEEAVAGTSCAA